MLISAVNLSKSCDGTKEATDDSSPKSASSSSSPPPKSSTSVGSECQETLVRLLRQIPSYYCDIYDLFREDKTIQGKDIRQLCGDQLDNATDLFLEFYKEGNPVMYQYLGEEVSRMMKVNIDKLLPLLRSSPYAHEMLVDLDQILCGVRNLIIRGVCLKGETWCKGKESRELN